MLELHHLIKAYPGMGRALDDVSFSLPGGRSWAFWGERGGENHPPPVHPGLVRFRGRSPWTASP